MPKVTKIINGEYIGGEKYTITDAGEGKSIISFSPDTVLKEGTPVGAEILNEMQKNGIYSLIGTRNISGQKEIYTCNIDGINDFGLFDIVLIVTPNITNTTQNIYLDLSGNEFQIIGNNIISAGDLQANEPYIFKLTSITKKAFLIGSDKLKKGTYSGKASDLKTEIDGKVSKDGDTVTGNLTMTGTAPIEIDVSSFQGSWSRGIVYKKNGSIIGTIGALGDNNGLNNLYFSHGVGEPEVKVLDGDVVILSTRLNTSTKEFVGAINELNNKKMEGSMLATILGTTYEGYVQTPGLKLKGKVYSSTTSNSFFMCTVDTNVVDVDYRYFTGASIGDIVRKTFSIAKSELTPIQGYLVTYRQINEKLAWITYQNLLTSNNLGIEYYLPFQVDSIAMARATSQGSNNYIKVLDGLSSDTFRLMSTNSVTDAKVELLVYATNSLIDW